MIILGLTGSIAMGKSTASAMFRRLRVPVHDSDAAVHHIYDHDPEFQAQIKTHFPSAFNKSHHKINRQKLSEIIFNDQDKKHLLEYFLHPKVHKSQNKFIMRQRQLKKPLCVLDIPLLYETGAEKRCDYVAVISAPAHIQRARALSRPNMDEQTYLNILNAQIPDQIKRARADFIIPSGLGLKHMLQAIKKLIARLAS